MTYIYNLYVYDCTYFKLLYYTSSREKNLVNQSAVFCVKKCAKTHLRPSEIGKNFPGVIPRTPEATRKGKVGKGRQESGVEGRRGEGEEREGRGGATALQNVCLFSPLLVSRNRLRH
jgi:hypothetical protein